MRVAVDTRTEVGNRMVRTLLAEGDVAFVGILNEAVPSRKRSGSIDDVSGFDVLVTDGEADTTDLLAQASVAGCPLVVWPELARIDSSATVPVVHDANVSGALTAALATHPATEVSVDDTLTVAWTEPGKPLKRGHPLPFPDPIGVLWGKKRDDGRYVAFRDDEWAGAVIDIDGASGRRIVGVADHGPYLEALILAGVTIAAARGHYATGTHPASSQAEHLLPIFDELETEIAVWRSGI